MNLEARKIEFIQEFLKIQSEEVIIRLEKLLQKEKSASEKELIKPLTFEELNSRIDQSMEDSKSGKLINSDDLKVVIDKWN